MKPKKLSALPVSLLLGTCTMVIGKLIIYLLTPFGIYLERWLLRSMSIPQHATIYANTMQILITALLGLIVFLVAYISQTNKNNNKIKNIPDAKILRTKSQDELYKILLELMQ